MIKEKLLTNNLKKDFEGQKLAERIFQVIIVISAVIGFVTGYATERFSNAVYILAAGFIAASSISIPPWPVFKRNPLKWQPVEKEKTEPETTIEKKKK